MQRCDEHPRLLGGACRRRGNGQIEKSEAGEHHGRQQKFPQMRQSHDSKDSIRVGSNPLWRGQLFVTLEAAVKILIAASLAVAALALPAVARALPGTPPAGTATIAFRDVPTGAAMSRGERSLAASLPVFDLVGLRWRGSGGVHFSVRSAGRWGPWLDAAPEEEDQPDRGTAEAAATRGWRLGNPTWVGPSTGIRYRIHGDVRNLRASFVRSPELKIPLRAVAAAGAPPVVPRSAWGADESIRRNQPQLAAAVRFAIVHHTAGPNGYSPSQAAAIMRGIQVYHVKSNGWNDIGYNFLVDRYGTVYEGRYGGIDKNVVGAHARGFNTGSVGVAVIGTFESAALPAAAEAALEKVLAWRLDLAHVDPISTFSVVSGGSERFPAGIPVFLRAVSGHRDTGQTSCPGDLLYAQLGSIAGKTLALGLPKLFEPKVTGGLGSLVRFRARLSGPVPWRVSVVDPLGQELAAGTGQGPTVDWSWDASLQTATGIQWRIAAGAATPVTGTLGKLVTGTGPLAITGLAADPETISPNDDDAAEASTITYTTTAAATISVSLLDAAGVYLTDLAPPARQPAGEHTLTFDGLGQPDGVYTVVLTATGANGVPITQQLQITVTRTLGSVALTPAVFTPNGDGKADELRLTFQLAAPATVRLRVLRDGKWVATPFSGLLPAGPQALGWDGAKRVGVAPDGSYAAVLDATDGIGTATVSLPFLKDIRAPVISLLGRPPRLRFSEAAAVTLRVNGSRRRFEVAGPGVVPLTGIKRVRSLVVVARDAAGNATILRRP